MSRLFKSLAAITLGLTCATSMAATPPRQLVTHNLTDVESNAFVAGTIPSQHPTKAHSDGKVIWTEVRMACFGHTVNGKCAALIKMATGPNDGGTPVELGTIILDLNSGEMTPSQLTANGYTMRVNGPGEATISKQ